MKINKIDDEIIDNLDSAETIPEAKQAYIDGMNRVDPMNENNLTGMTAEKYAEIVADSDDVQVDMDIEIQNLYHNSNLGKKKVENIYQDRLDELDSDNGTSPNDMKLDTFLINHVDYVMKTCSTDSHIDPIYKWVFNNDEWNNVETIGEHNNHGMFIEKIFDRTGLNVHTPEKNGNKEWKHWVRNFISERVIVTETKGSRQKVIDSIREYIQESRAFTELGEAFDNNKMYYDEGNDNVYVLSTKITSKCENEDVTSSALQSELYNEDEFEKDMTKKGRGQTPSLSKELTHDYKKKSYWRFPTEFAEPKDIVRPEEEEEEEEEEENTSRFSGGSNE